MSRLAEDIALLRRVAAICGQAIDAAPNVAVANATFETLAEEIAAARSRPVDYRLIADEALCLVIAAQNVTWARADGDAVKLDRWLAFAKALHATVALDLDNARKSIGEAS